MANKTQEELALERRQAFEQACDDCSQAPIDLFLTIVAGDEEKRSASYWLEQSLVYAHKYTDRLRKYAAERKAQQQLAKDTDLFNRYIAMNPPKSPTELLTIMQRFNVCPQVAVGVNGSGNAPAAPASSDKSATKVA